jgi:maleate cis-trans isomerase
LTDSLGYRKKFAVVVPSTNTSVQPEFDEMRPAGVTNHVSCISIRDIPVNSSEDSVEVLSMIAASQQAAIDAAMSCHPDHMVLGSSAESFWDERIDLVHLVNQARPGGAHPRGLAYIDLTGGDLRRQAEWARRDPRQARDLVAGSIGPMRSSS